MSHYIIDYGKTKHTHNPVDGAIGNGEALIHIKNKFNLKMFEK